LREGKTGKEYGVGTVKDLGERKVIEIIKDHLNQMPGMPVPFGDDVSAVSIDNERVAVLKTDMLVGKTDVPREMSLWQAARKSLIMNVSDFAAKGVQPTAALVSLGLPANLMEKDIEEIAKGLNVGAQEYGVFIIGGDTGEASDLIISVSLFGIAERTRLMLRGGAKAGDIVAVTGFFGKTSAGMRLLLDGHAASQAQRELLVSSVFMPQARLKEGLALGSTEAVTASIDSSDGLAWSLHEIAKMSGVGFSITSLPVADEVKRFAEFNRLDPAELALYGGEEYELVVTIGPDLVASARKAVEAVDGKLLPIGKVTKEKRIVLNVDGVTKPIESRGYEHFKS
jgi:thiamine-monophosphate kinase